MEKINNAVILSVDKKTMENAETLKTYFKNVAVRQEITPEGNKQIFNFTAEFRSLIFAVEAILNYDQDEIMLSVSTPDGTKTVKWCFNETNFNRDLKGSHLKKVITKILGDNWNW